MQKRVLYIGLDVDDNKFHGYCICEKTGEAFPFTSRPNASKLISTLKKIESKGFSLKLCYEACYLGFALYRELEAAGIQCDVVASNMIPSRPGERVKTDRKDSEKLALLYMKDMLTPVHVPTKEDENDRDLVRSREFLREQLNSFQRHLISLCRRSALHFKDETGKLCHWTKTHVRWIQDKISSLPGGSLKNNLNFLMMQITELRETISSYDAEIEKLSREKKYKKKVQALTCFKGLSELSAMTVITEIQDIRRFPHPKKLVSYLGFDISEYSSGGKEKKYGITKMGNSRVRKRLVESCQKCHMPTFAYTKKFRDRSLVPKDILSIADKCSKRLFKKSTRLIAREKNRNKVKVACAREMSTFIWESLMMVA